MIKAKEKVVAGFTLARTPRKTVRTKDITGGSTSCGRTC